MRAAVPIAVPVTTSAPTSTEPLVSKVERIKQALGLQATTTQTIIVEAEALMGIAESEGQLQRRADALLVAIGNLREKAQRLQQMFGIDATLNLAATIAQANKETDSLPNNRPLPTQADALIGML